MPSPLIVTALFDPASQDAQTFRPHVTVQNKVTPELARETEASLAGLSQSGHVTGLALWHYRGGPWEEAGGFPFCP